MVELDASFSASQLQDPFAQTVLHQNIRPDSVDKIVGAMSSAQLQQSSFLIGEGSQVPLTTAPRDADRSLRYVISWVTANNGPGVFLSAAPGGHSSFLQVVAWDAVNGVFNFYEYRAQLGSATPKAWSWAGETTLSQAAPTRGVGCFDCHHNGVTIMKELVAPWNNWQSQLANVSPTIVPENVAEETLFQTRSGAEILESFIRGGYQTYYQGWLRKNYQRQSDGSTKLTAVNEMLRRLTTNTTINLASSQVQSRGHATSPPNAPITGIPNNLFVWDDVLRTGLGLPYEIPALNFARADFDSFLTKYQFQLNQTGTSTYSEPGSTWFSFFVPVPAVEDQYLALQLMNARVFSPKFVASILLVDFPNPTFSSIRANLQRYGEQIQTGTISKDGQSSVETDFVALVTNAARTQTPCSGPPLQCTAEQQFLITWQTPGDWKAKAGQVVQSYLDTNVKSASLDTIMRLAEARRQALTQAPLLSNLVEFPLLFPANTLKAE